MTEPTAAPVPAPDAPPPPQPAGVATVRLQRSNEPAAGVAVLVHDQAGAFLREALTAADGTATVAVDAHDMITVTPPGDLMTWADVYPGDDMQLDLDGGIGSGEVLGSLRLAVANLPGNANYVLATAGCDEYGPDAASNVPVTGELLIPLRRRCLGSDGKAHVVAYAQQTGVVVGTAFAIDIVPPGAGETVDVALSNWQVATHEFLYAESNHGSGPLGSPTLWSMRTGIRYYAPTRSGGLAGPTTVIAPGFAQAIAFRTSFNYDAGGAFGVPCRRSFVLGVLEANTPAHNLDATADVLPLFTGAGADNGDLARPTLAVSPSAALDAAADGWLIRTRFGNGTTWGVLMPRDMREVRLPELPASYQGARPNGVDQPYAVGVAGELFGDDAAFRATGMNLLFGSQFLSTEPGVLRGTSWFPSCF